MSVSLVARRHGIGGNQIFIWRRLMAQGALTAAAAGEEVVPASEYRALEAQVRELHQLLGKKAMENELLREAVSRAAGPKKLLLRSTSLPRDGRWLTDNGSCYTARNTRAFARDIGLIRRTTPVSSPQSNGMAEAFARIFKRDYVRVNPKPNAQSVIDQLPGWFAHYNEVHPHRALRYRSPREFIAKTCEARSGL
jgi:transposase InsO family protein